MLLGVSEEIVRCTACCHCWQWWHRNRTCVCLYSV